MAFRSRFDDNDSLSYSQAALAAFEKSLLSEGSDPEYRIDSAREATRLTYPQALKKSSWPLPLNFSRAAVTERFQWATKRPALLAPPGQLTTLVQSQIKRRKTFWNPCVY